MPFIEDDRRDAILEGVLPQREVTPGDRCFVEYYAIMKAWRANPRWTTIDKMAENFIRNDQDRAWFLAFLVFFNLHGMPYEHTKREQNGDI